MSSVFARRASAALRHACPRALGTRACVRFISFSNPGNGQFQLTGSLSPILDHNATRLETTARRQMSLQGDELEKRMRDVNDMFVESRELIADALDSQGTKYFQEDLDDAQDMVKSCLDSYEKVLEELDEEKKGEIQRSMGMKMRQLKDELGQIINSLTHDEDLPQSNRKD